MKRFLTNCAAFSAVIIGSVYFVLNQGDGYTDAFYARFTTPKQTSLIVGSSRAAQGILPSVLDTSLSRDDFFNFSFTIADSPYGPTYLRAIKKKLDANARNSIFIVTVDPWSIASDCESPNDTTTFRELNGCLAKSLDMNANPNIGYLINAFKGRYINLLTKNPQMSLADDGWLEMTINMDPAQVEVRTKRKVESYGQMVSEYCFSQVRMDYLIKTIAFLKDHGPVFLVRLPVSHEIKEIETEMLADFDSRLEPAIALCEGYLDMTVLDSEYVFTDGNHLSRESAIEVSESISDWIHEQSAKKVTLK